MARLRFVTDTDDLVSSVIRSAQLGYWASHVEAVMPDGTYLGAHSDGGVLARQPGYDQKYQPLECFVDIPATPQQDAIFHAFLIAQLGKPYDMAAIRSFAVGLITARQFNWREPDHWICSEVQAAAVEAAGLVAHFGPNHRAITPQNLSYAVNAVVEYDDTPLHAFLPPMPAPDALVAKR